MIRSSHQGHGDRGATIVEFALVLPLLLLLGLGTVEMGLGFVAHDRVETATAQAARVAAVSGSRAEADRDILMTLQTSLPAEELANLDRVVIFKPSSTQGAVPAGCIKVAGDSSQTGTSTCNTYTGATVRSVTATDMTGFGGGITAADRYWAPSTRKDTLAGPPDYIGVWLRTTHENITGAFFGDLAMTKVSIFRIQPDLTG
jgi:Flp pilus assembly protein TadG